MKLRKIAIIMIALLIIVPSALGEEFMIDLAGYTEGYNPWQVMVYARDPLGKLEGIVHYEADPMESNPGEMNDTTVNLNTVYELFGNIQPMQAVDEANYPDASDLRFSIAYILDLNGASRTIQLDFYDYSDAVGITILDSDESVENTIFEGFGLMEHAYSTAFEKIYLDRVASLQRIPNWDSNDELIP